jgi:hypothetical protein
MLTPLVSLIPLRWPLSVSLRFDTPLITLPSSGELGDGATGETAGLEGWRPEMWDTELVAEVWDATDGEAVRPLGELREAPPERARGVKPVPESESSWGREVSIELFSTLS